MLEKQLAVKIKDAARHCDELQMRAPNLYIAAAIVILAEAVESIANQLEASRRQI